MAVVVKLRIGVFPCGLFPQRRSEPVLAPVYPRTRPPPEKVQVLGPVPVEQLVLVDPKGPLSVHLAKVVKVQLPDQGLKPRVTKVLGKRFGLEPVQVSPDLEGIAAWRPLRRGRKLRGEQLRSAPSTTLHQQG